MGGEGTIIGKLFGALLIGILNNDMNLLNVNPYFQMVIKGVVIFGAVYLSILTRKNNR
ncbi:MAG: putative xylitol transport system permease protein [Petrotoga sp.]|nr:putative xylitol transport system permease protein [Petrotoga sp.]